MLPSSLWGQIARVRQQLKAEPEETHVRLHSFNPARISLRTRLDELEANLQGYQETHRSALAQLKVKRQTLNELGPWEAELARLNRARDVAQASYTQLAERLQDLDFRMGGRMPTARVIDKAYPPDQPIRPRKALALALSCVLGLMLASGIVCLQELAGDRIQAKTEGLVECSRWLILLQNPQRDRLPTE